MRKQEAVEFITARPEQYLTQDKSKKGYICPVCGSGSGSKGTGITTKDGKHFTCWAGCYTNSDIIDIIGIERGITGFTEKLAAACSEYDIDYADLENDYSIGIEPSQKQARNGQKTDNKQQPHNTDNTYNTDIPQQTDYTEFYKQAAANLNNCNYLTRRGISPEIQKQYLIGYVEEWQSPTALKNGKQPPKSRRIIIPTSRYSYLARSIDKDTRAEFKAVKEGKTQIFNLKALQQTAAPFFIVEGEIDALSIIEIGYNAIALGSVSMYKRLVDYLKSNRPEYPLHIALDNDEAGKKAAGELKAELDALQIENYIVDIYGDSKDANEALLYDRAAFIDRVEYALTAAERAKQEEYDRYMMLSNSGYVDEFINGISRSIDTPYIKTGFKDLDSRLDGGLYEGLYIIGAISSLGKTTFILQIADQIAAAGNDVLIFSLEMARTELIAKSISRQTAVIADKQGVLNYAKTLRGITVHNFYKNYSPEELQIIDEAETAYKEYANRIYVFEGMGNIGVKEIRKTVDKHITITGNKPIVIIDYLQIIAPYEPRATDKQNTDKAVLELKRMSRDDKLTIIGISSFNRDNYNTAVNMAAFKESGAIEYGSDVLMGLQLEGAGKKNFNVDEAKSKIPRKVELRIIKNRNGAITRDAVLFDYYPQYNYFREEGFTEIKDDNNNPFNG